MQTDTKAGTKGGVREFYRKRRIMNQAGSIVKNPYNIMVVQNARSISNRTISCNSFRIQSAILQLHHSGMDSSDSGTGEGRGCLPSITGNGF